MAWVEVQVISTKKGVILLHQIIVDKQGRNKNEMQ
jgi:hypothetical protein